VKFKLWRWYGLCPEVNKEIYKAATVMMMMMMIIIIINNNINIV
jgi:hypothetical protein